MTRVVDADGRVATVIDTDQSGDGPKQYVRVSFDGGVLAIAIALLALGGVLVAAILIPTLIDKAATAASAGAVVRSQISERESRLNAEDVKLIRIALEKHGIKVDDQ